MFAADIMPPRVSAVCRSGAGNKAPTPTLTKRHRHRGAHVVYSGSTSGGSRLRAADSNCRLTRLRSGRNAFEEVDHAGLERVLGADDDQAVGLNQPLEKLGPVTQMVGRCAYIGTHRR